jgi:prepilin-type N-terminal cleavage/methylation domain-containing protein
MRSGFTLVEILVTSAIALLIMIAIGGFAAGLFSQNTTVQKWLLGQNEAQAALRAFTAELRSAATADTGAYPLATAAADQLTFYSDLNGDGTHDRLRYYVQNGTLWRGVLKPTGSPLAYVEANEVLTQPVHSLVNPSGGIFTYYDASYTGISTPLGLPVNIPSVRLIKVTLTVDADPNRPPAPVSYVAQVQLRSLKDNL